MNDSIYRPGFGSRIEWKNIDLMKNENFQLKINGEIAMFTGILIDILKIYKIIWHKIILKTHVHLLKMFLSFY